VVYVSAVGRVVDLPSFCSVFQIRPKPRRVDIPGFWCPTPVPLVTCNNSALSKHRRITEANKCMGNAFSSFSATLPRGTVLWIVRGLVARRLHALCTVGKGGLTRSLGDGTSCERLHRFRLPADSCKRSNGDVPVGDGGLSSPAGSVWGGGCSKNPAGAGQPGDQHSINVI
jgi:hypothetical protein